MDVKLCELVINGFVRRIEKLMDHQIIPSSLNIICFKYFYARLLIIAIHNTFIRIGDIDNNTNWKYDIIQSPKCSKLPKLKMENAAVCFAKDVAIPSFILNELNKESKISKIKRTKYNVIFHSNRYWQRKYNTSCNSFRSYIINPAIIKEVNTNKTYLYEIRLPQIPNTTIRANDLIFCHKTKSLISIGGITGSGHGYAPTHDAYQLIFDDELQWKSMPNLTTKRSCSTSVFVDGCTKLMVIGGQGNMFSNTLNNVEIYDAINNKWTVLDNINHERMANGICYDEISQQVYICGGFDGRDYGGVRTVEYYDLHHNKWYNNLPDIKCNHDYYPLTWIQDQNLLNIASVTARVIETLDLRANKKKWQVHYDGDKFDNIFGEQIESSDAAKYRLFS